MAKQKEKQVNKSRKAKVYITESGKVVSEDILKRYQLKGSKQTEKDTERFGTNVINPPHNLARLLSWLDESVVHSSCVRTKVQDSFGLGYTIKEKKENEPTSEQDMEILSVFFHKVNEKENITSMSKKVGLDLEGCGNGYIEVVREPNEEKGIKALYHVNATTIRLTKDKKKWVQSIGQKKVYFKHFGDEKIMDKDTGTVVESIAPEKAANEVIQLMQYSYKSAYYGVPEWLPALYNMYADSKEREYNLDFFENHGIPAYAVVLENVNVEGDFQEVIKNYFDTAIKQNPHRTMVFEVPEGGKVIFEKLSVEAKEASFRIYKKDNRDDILTAHKVPPYRAAIVEKGQLGGNVAREVDEIYMDSVVNPRQNEFEWVLTELIIKEGFGIETAEFKFDEIDIRDQKLQAEIDERYFKMGARTPNEILEAQGKEPYEGGDVYYIAGTMVPMGVAKDKKFKGKEGEQDASDRAVQTTVPEEEEEAGKEEYTNEENTEE